MQALKETVWTTPLPEWSTDSIFHLCILWVSSCLDIATQCLLLGYLPVIQSYWQHMECTLPWNSAMIVSSCQTVIELLLPTADCPQIAAITLTIITHSEAIYIGSCRLWWTSRNVPCSRVSATVNTETTTQLLRNILWITKQLEKE